MSKQFFILFCLIVLIIACQPTETPELTGAQRQAIADEISQKTQEMWDLAQEFNEENFNKMFDLIVESDEESWMGNPALWVSNQNLFPTQESMDAAFRPMLKQRTSTNFTMLKNYIAVLSANYAVHVYKAKYSITNLKGETGPEFPQTVTTVWVRKNGEWKILHSHDSWSGKAIETQIEKETEK